MHVSELTPDNHCADSTDKLTYVKMSRNPNVAISSLIITTAFISSTFLDPTLEPHLRPLKLTPGQLGLVWLAAAGSFCAMSPVVGIISTKLGSKFNFNVSQLNLMAFGLLGMTISLVYLGPSHFVHIRSTIASNVSSFVVFQIMLAVAIIPTFEYLLHSVTAQGAEHNLITHGLVSGW